MSGYQYSDHHQRTYSDDPEVVPSPSPLPQWIDPAHIAPEVVGSEDGYTKTEWQNIGPSPTITQAHSHRPIWKRKLFLVPAAVGLLVIIGLAVGLGVGLSTKQNSSESDEAEKSSNADSVTPPTCNDSLCPPVLSFLEYQDTMHVFARASDNRIVVQKNSGSGWDSDVQDMGNPGAPFISQPAAQTWSVHNDFPRLDLFAIGGDDRTIYTRYHSEQEGWSDWTAAATNAGTAVSLCLFRPYRLDSWSTDWDTTLMTHMWWRQRQDDDISQEGLEDGVTADHGEFSDWSEFDDLGATRGAPAVVCRDAGGGQDHDIVWYDARRDKAWHSRFLGSAGWSSPQSFEGAFVGDPTVVWFNDTRGRWDFFGVQEDGEMYHLYWTMDDGGYSAMESIGGSFLSVPAVVSTHAGVMDAVALGTDGYLRHKHYDGENWAEEWEELQVAAHSAPTAGVFQGKVYVVAIKEDGSMLSLSRSATEPPSELWRSELTQEDLGGNYSREFLTTDS